MLKRDSLRALAILQVIADSEPLPTGALCELAAMTYRDFSRVSVELQKAGILTRGPARRAGCLRLARPLEEVRVREVAIAAQHWLELTCPIVERHCTAERPCRARAHRDALLDLTVAEALAGAEVAA